ncbi:hypothetical protein BHE74_00053743 [Ensete ventricosum]|nr:hypothetical protein BHE74_00053743 [Ensete ventricosum]RZR99312.1 hypothetical protein BHM03_00028828 [Ensete ventricosum]
MYRVDTVGNSPGVRRELTEGIRSLPGWHKGVHQKKIETHRKIIGGSRKACQDSDDAVGSRRKFAKRFAERIGKLAGNTKGDRWKKDRRTYPKMPEAVGLCGKSGQRPALSAGKPPRSMGEPPVSEFS